MRNVVSVGNRAGLYFGCCRHEYHESVRPQSLLVNLPVVVCDLLKTRSVHLVVHLVMGMLKI